MALTVRDAELGDLDAIYAIYNEQVLHGTATFDTEPRVRGADDAWLTARDRVRHPVLVADDGGVVAGWASLGPWSPRGAYARTAEASVYVHPGHRRRGVGRLLLAALVERGRAAGLGVLIARIAEANPASVALFEAAGFGHIGTQRRCGEKLGRVLDVELMDLHLDGERAPARPRGEPPIELDAIGRVESPLVERAAAPRQGDEGAPAARVVVDPAYGPALAGIAAGDRLVVVTWLDRADRGVLRVHPRDDPARPLAGVFATRSPDRPNPIGLHEVTVVAIAGTTLTVEPLEAIDGTPVLDLKPVLRAAR